MITPTYARPQQKADLIKFANTILHVHKIHWIIIEDAPYKTDLVTRFVQRTLNFARNKVVLQMTHLNVQTSSNYRNELNDPHWLRPRGVEQRNEALKWLRENSDSVDSNGVVYFADDDNTYDVQLFDEIRSTKKVACWPVGLVGGLMVERPLVEDGKIIGFNSAFKPQRMFPIDMAGFSINVAILLTNSQAYFTLKVARGYQETYLLKQLVRHPSEMEPKAENCSKVLVWHTRTETPNLNREAKLKTPSNIIKLKLTEKNIEV